MLFRNVLFRIFLRNDGTWLSLVGLGWYLSEAVSVAIYSGEMITRKKDPLLFFFFFFFGPSVRHMQDGMSEGKFVETPIAGGMMQKCRVAELQSWIRCYYYEVRGIVEVEVEVEAAARRSGFHISLISCLPPPLRLPRDHHKPQTTNTSSRTAVSHSHGLTKWPFPSITRTHLVRVDLCRDP